MKKLISSVVVGCLATFLPTSAFAATIVVAYDGTFLGVVDSNAYNSDSICNQYGEYGSRYGTGIFNRYGTHGDRYSETSAYNERAENPPLLIKDGQPIANVTKNLHFKNRLDPDFLQQMACRH